MEGEGIVLIDELDLHMRPAWQRKILSVLRKLFPNIQFLITTHSPQILGEVDRSYNLFMLEKMQLAKVSYTIVIYTVRILTAFFVRI